MSSKCLFMVEDWPITPDAYGGMSSLIHSHLLVMIESGLAVSMVTLSRSGHSQGFEGFKADNGEKWDGLRGKLSSHHELAVRSISKKRMPLKAMKTILTHFPGYSFIPDKATKEALSEIALEIRPDFVWAEDVMAAMIAVQCINETPIVYSHNDWKWRIKQYRTMDNIGQWHKSVKFWLRRLQEERLVQEVSACVSASASEAEEIRSLGVQKVFYFPTTYSPVQIKKRLPELSEVRIVHLGGMQTTANRLGLERFLDVSWPLISQALLPPPALWVIGSMSGGPATLLSKLEQVNATCTGFVEDLTTVLRPHDIHIVPWEYNTGTRTRIPLVLNYSQALVSTRAAAACLPELQHRKNCLLADNLIQFAQEIITLINDPEQRQRLAKAGREAFEQQFTWEAMQPRFNQFLHKLKS